MDRDRIPEDLQAVLADTVADGAIALAIVTDLTPEGLFGQEWLIATTSTLHVFSLASSLNPRMTVASIIIQAGDVT